MEKFTLVKRIIARILAFFGFCIFLFLVLMFTMPKVLVGIWETINNQIQVISRHKIDNPDFGDVRNYSSNFIGVSFDYPSSYNFKQVEMNQPGVIWSTPNNNLDMKIAFDNSKSSFDLGLKLGEFKLDENIGVFKDCRNNLVEINPVLSLLVNKAEAVCMTTHKASNVQQISINNNTYYTYSYYLKRDRHDRFLLPRDSDFITFEFENLNTDAIKSILSSLKAFEPTRE